MGKILQRVKTRVPTPGSQRRCYDGCWHPDDWFVEWTAWVVLESDAPESRLEFWRDLNDYAVKERGESARKEFRYEP